MKLYHFCPDHLLEQIKKEGLTLGAIPVVKGGRYSVLKNCQWLTKNPSFDQEWEKYSTLPYRRNAFRITVKIPKTDPKLFTWEKLSKIKPLQEVAKDLNAYGDPENWFVYWGKIKPKYFREIVKG